MSSTCFVKTWGIDFSSRPRLLKWINRVDYTGKNNLAGSTTFKVPWSPLKCTTFKNLHKSKTLKMICTVPDLWNLNLLLAFSLVDCPPFFLCRKNSPTLSQRTLDRLRPFGGECAADGWVVRRLRLFRRPGRMAQRKATTPIWHSGFCG